MIQFSTFFPCRHSSSSLLQKLKSKRYHFDHIKVHCNLVSSPRVIWWNDRQENDRDALRGYSLAEKFNRLSTSFRISLPLLERMESWLPGSLPWSERINRTLNCRRFPRSCRKRKKYKKIEQGTGMPAVGQCLMTRTQVIVYTTACLQATDEDEQRTRRLWA